MQSYNPISWFWRHDDGRIYSSADEALIQPDEPAYQAWQAKGAQPTVWPRNEAGEQTDEALQDVLRPYGRYVTLGELKQGLKIAVDAGAETERLRYITGGAGQAMTYARKVDQARAVQAMADPVDFPLLSASIGIDGEDIQAVAATVLAMDAAWELIGAAIEAARLGAKRAIDLAETAEDARAVVPAWPVPPG